MSLTILFQHALKSSFKFVLLLDNDEKQDMKLKQTTSMCVFCRPDLYFAGQNIY